MSVDTTNPFLMALMPLSQAAGWTALILAGSNGPTPTTRAALYPNILAMSSFYCSWALYKKFFQGDKNELGHISMGLTALATLLFPDSKWPTAAAVTLILGNFGVVAKIVLVDLSAADLAKAVKKSVLWARIFRGYFVSSMLFWSTVLYKVIQTQE